MKEGKHPIYQAALDLDQAGFKLVKVDGITKRGHVNWSTSPLSPLEFENPGAAQLGVLNGPHSGFTITADFDLSDEMYEHFVALHAPNMPPTNMIEGRPGREMTHWTYQIVDPDRDWSEEELPSESSAIGKAMRDGTFPFFFGKYQWKNRMTGDGIDLLGASAYHVVPPSLTKHGTRREWFSKGIISPGRITFDQLISAVEEIAIDLDIPTCRREEMRPSRPDPIDVMLMEKDPESLIERARAYIGNIPAAVSGEGGDHQTFKVAAALRAGFLLEPEDCLPILLEYNKQCSPPWTVEKLRHKLDCVSLDYCTGWLLENPDLEFQVNRLTRECYEAENRSRYLAGLCSKTRLLGSLSEAEFDLLIFGLNQSFPDKGLERRLRKVRKIGLNEVEAFELEQQKHALERSGKRVLSYRDPVHAAKEFLTYITERML